MFKAVIFDRDGVIVDSEWINVESAVYAFKELGISITEEETEKIIGRHPDDYVHYFLKKHTFSYEHLRKIQSKKYSELLASTPFFQHVIDLIKELHSRNIPVALTTSSSKRGTLELLEKAKLSGIFKVVVTSEDYIHKKPNPEPYLVTARKLKVKPEYCIVFEDTSVGVEAAKNAGMKCIAVPNEFTRKQDFSKADLVIRSADKININILSKF